MATCQISVGISENLRSLSLCAGGFKSNPQNKRHDLSWNISANHFIFVFNGKQESFRLVYDGGPFSVKWSPPLVVAFSEMIPSVFLV